MSSNFFSVFLKALNYSLYRIVFTWGLTCICIKLTYVYIFLKGNLCVDDTIFNVWIEAGVLSVQIWPQHMCTDSGLCILYISVWSDKTNLFKPAFLKMCCFLIFQRELPEAAAGPCPHDPHVSGAPLPWVFPEEEEEKWQQASGIRVWEWPSRVSAPGQCG